MRPKWKDLIFTLSEKNGEVSNFSDKREERKQKLRCRKYKNMYLDFWYQEDNNESSMCTVMKVLAVECMLQVGKLKHHLETLHINLVRRSRDDVVLQNQSTNRIKTLTQPINKSWLSWNNLTFTECALLASFKIAYYVVQFENLTHL